MPQGVHLLTLMRLVPERGAARPPRSSCRGCRESQNTNAEAREDKGHKLQKGKAGMSCPKLPSSASGPACLAGMSAKITRPQRERQRPSLRMAVNVAQHAARTSGEGSKSRPAATSQSAPSSESTERLRAYGLGRSSQ